jgi:hypothetical protein
MCVLVLQASMQLINPAVGDALSDMLYCLAALQVTACLHSSFLPRDWHSAVSVS